MSHSLREALGPIPGALWAEMRALATDPGNWRLPAKVVLAVWLAVMVAAATHLDDEAWAALSAFLVMRNGFRESAPRGFARLLGSLAGAGCGLALARFVAPAPPLLMVALFVVTWIGVFQSTVSALSYAWVLFGLTTAMVMSAAFAAPELAIAFAATRVAEVAIGTGCGILVSAVFEVFGQSGPPPAATPGLPGSRLSWRHLRDEDWLAAHWGIIAHATRAAIAVGLLPLVWRAFGITDISQTAITSFIVMIVPMTALEHDGMAAIYQRIAHRLLGCLLGAVLALLMLPFVGDSLPLWLLALAVGVGVGVHVQGGKAGVSYVGTQAVFAFIVTFVQGTGPATSITPGLERLLGIAIGCTMLIAVVLAWPPTQARPQPAG